MSKIRVRCKVMPGLFKSEYSVLVNHAGAYYIDKRNVTVEVPPSPLHEEVDGIVTAYVVQKSGGRILIQLPGEAAVGGQRIWITKEEIAA